MKKFILFILFICTLTSLSLISINYVDNNEFSPDEPFPLSRDYYAQLNPAEEEDIRYIITTLSENSTIGLLKHKKTLKKTGLRLKHIHPLRFLAIIFSDSQMRAATNKIGSVAWYRFKKAMVKNLDTEAERNNINESVVQNFCEIVQEDYNEIFPIIKEEKWSLLMDNLLP